MKLDTRKQILAAADHMEQLALLPADPNPLARHRVGCLSIRTTPKALMEAATLIRSNASRRAGIYGYIPVARKTGIDKLDAMRVYGDAQEALDAILRQLEIQGDDMKPADVKRCMGAAREIQRHLVAEHEKERRKAQADQEEAEFKAAGRISGITAPLEPGTPIYVHHNYRNYRAVVVKCAPTRSAGMHYTVSLTHERKSEKPDYLYLFYPLKKPRTVKVHFTSIRKPVEVLQQTA